MESKRHVTLILYGNKLCRNLIIRVHIAIICSNNKKKRNPFSEIHDLISHYCHRYFASYALSRHYMHKEGRVMQHGDEHGSRYEGT